MESLKKMLKNLVDSPVQLLILIAVILIIVFYVFPYVKSAFMEGMDNMDDDEDDTDYLDDDEDVEDDEDDEDDDVVAEGFGKLGTFRFGEGFGRKRRFRKIGGGVAKAVKNAEAAKKAARKARKDGYRKYM